MKDSISKNKITDTTFENNIPINEENTYLIIRNEDFNFINLNSREIQNPIEFPFKANSINELETFIIEVIKQEENLNIFQKITFTKSILVNKDKFSELKEFYEEECHLSLLNWVWKERKTLKYPNIYFNKLLGILYLLNNILNIFQILHFNSNDIIELKLFDKLNNIKGLIKNWKIEHPILNLISNILNKWKSEIEELKEIKLNQKRNRSDDETEFESDINLLNNNIKVNNSKNFNKKVKKNISIELSKNRIIYFDKDEIPSSISQIKNAYDPLL